MRVYTCAYLHDRLSQILYSRPTPSPSSIQLELLSSLNAAATWWFSKTDTSL